MQSIMYDGNNKCDVWDFVVGDEGYTNCHQRFDNSLTVDLPNQRLVIKEQNTVICLDRETETYMVCTPQQMLFLAMS
jgi:hypothetical protein